MDVFPKSKTTLLYDRFLMSAVLSTSTPRSTPIRADYKPPSPSHNAITQSPKLETLERLRFTSERPAKEIWI
ncbi:hypothetical protein AMEX_G21638 [Astyanax mexicanus]|uniref:Uncharacterized protein n=1 Tax=Astyanax mexicanus TaxID=7994 RepID=A0A8T2L8I3_ASTMX|nr:hypothetical protein AMEX_G21638 [Astyanax mexicanus]